MKRENPANQRPALKGSRRAFAVSLAALTHPSSLLAVGLLLFNDHWIKAHYPSILSGKLSDAAGLFFFPFLLTAFLSLLYPPQTRPRRVAGLAFALVGIGFSGIKLSPAVNLIMTEVVARLVGYETTITLDPTDLVALLAIWPAWRLWLAHEERPISTRQVRLGYLALGVASLASLATQPCLPIPVIDRLVAVDGLLYAHLNHGWPEEPLEQQTAVSSDGGRSWNTLDSIPDGLASRLLTRATLPLTACSEADGDLCYRVNGTDKVERSKNGGVSWEVAWQTPWGREYFMDRYVRAGGPGLFSCKREIDSGPYDLALIDSTAGPSVVVAMGNEGVLYGDTAGNWQRVRVERAVPTPYRARSLPDAVFLLYLESIIFFLTGFLTLIGFIILGARALDRSKIPGEPDQRGISWYLRPVIFIMVYLFLSLTIAYLGIFQPRFLPRGWDTILTAITFYFISWSTLAVPIIGFLLTYRRLRRIAPGPHGGGWVFKTGLLAGAGIFPVAWLALLAWGFGLIPSYPLAAVIAIFLSLLVWRWGGARIRISTANLSRPAGGG